MNPRQLPHRVIGLALVIAMAGCASTSVRPEQETSISNLPPPSVVLVHRLGVNLSEVKATQGLYGKTVDAVEHESVGQEEAQLGREVSTDVTDALVKNITAMGLNAQIATLDTAAMANSLIITGYFRDIDEGNKMRQLVRHVLYAPDTGEWHIRPTAHGGMILGSDVVDDMIDETSDAETLAAATRALLERGRRYLPELPADTHGHDALRQIGVRPMPEDGRTIAGPLPGVPGCYVIATHSGITLAPLLGELIAEEIDGGEMPSMLAPFRHDRFDGG